MKVTGSFRDIWISYQPSPSLISFFSTRAMTSARAMAAVPRLVRTQAFPAVSLFNARVNLRQSPLNITREVPGDGV